MFDIDFGKWTLRIIIGFALMYIGSFFIGQVPPFVRINVTLPGGSSQQSPDPAQENARRAAEDARKQAEQERLDKARIAEIKRKEEAALAEIRHREAIARAEAEANRRKVEAEEAARQAEEIRRRRIEAHRADQAEKSPPARPMAR